MIVQRKWIDIVEQKQTGKTRVFTVISKEEDMLGWIKWFGRWRKYAFFPEKDTVFETDCLNDISAFLKELMDERKNNKLKEMRNIKDYGQFVNEGMNCNAVAPWWHHFNKLVENGSSRTVAAMMAAAKFPNAKESFVELMEHDTDFEALSRGEKYTDLEKAIGDALDHVNQDPNLEYDIVALSKKSRNEAEKFLKEKGYIDVGVITGIMVSHGFEDAPQPR